MQIDERKFTPIVSSSAICAIVFASTDTQGKGPAYVCEILYIEERPNDHLKIKPNKGLEPLTLRLKVWCSTDWANRAADIPTVDHQKISTTHAFIIRHRQFPAGGLSR